MNDQGLLIESRLARTKGKGRSSAVNEFTKDIGRWKRKGRKDRLFPGRFSVRGPKQDHKKKMADEGRWLSEKRTRTWERNE